MTTTSIQTESTVKGILFVITALFLLTVSDAVTKWLGKGYPVGEILFFRAMFALLPVFLIALHEGGVRSIRIHNIWGQGLRAILSVLSTALIALSMILLPLVEASTLLFAGPLFVACLSPAMLGERVSWQLWGAIGVGFAGVVIALRPTPDAIQLLPMIPIAAALISALRDIVTRKISRTENTNAILFYSMATLAVLAPLTAPFGWATPDLEDLGLMAISGFCVGCAHYLMIEAYRMAEAAVVSPFKYTAIFWAVILGYVFWGDLPDVWVLCGGALVIGSGIWILRLQFRR